MFSDNEDKQDEAPVIRNGMVKHTQVVDPRSIRATLIELNNLHNI